MSAEFDILIVEDEPVIIEAAKKILLPEGFKVDEAYDAARALQNMRHTDYNLIISDLMLPNISGMDLLTSIKNDLPLIPVIIITGYATLENALKSFKFGAFDFIPKPFDIKELLGVVHRALNFYESRKNVRLNEFEYVRGTPVTCYALGNHSEVRLARDGSAILNVGTTFPNLMGKINDIEFPLIDAEILQGNWCAKIISSEDGVHRVWSPLSGRVVDVNLGLQQDVSLIDRDPLNQGWLVRIMPTNLENELENLMHW